MYYQCDESYQDLEGIQLIPLGEYENCEFARCSFKDAKLSEYIFTDCTFIDCDLSLSVLTSTYLKNVTFDNCKLVGIRFDACADFNFEIHLQECQLDYSVFNGKSLKRCNFIASNIIEVDFSECNLSEVIFQKCNLDRTNFNFTNLIKTDFSESFNISLDPSTNQVKGMKFPLSQLPHLLNKYDINIVADS